MTDKERVRKAAASIEEFALDALVSKSGKVKDIFRGGTFDGGYLVKATVLGPDGLLRYIRSEVADDSMDAIAICLEKALGKITDVLNGVYHSTDSTNLLAVKMKRLKADFEKFGLGKFEIKTELTDDDKIRLSAVRQDDGGGHFAEVDANRYAVDLPHLYDTFLSVLGVHINRNYRYSDDEMQNRFKNEIPWYI